MTSYNHEMTAISAPTYIPRLDKKIFLQRSLTSSGSATFVRKIGLVKNVISSVTSTIENIKSLIFLVFTTALPLLSRTNALSKIIYVYTNTLGTLIQIPNKILSVSFSVTPKVVRALTKKLSPVVSGAVSIVVDGAKELYVISRTRVFVLKAYILPGLLSIAQAILVPTLTRLFYVTNSVSSTVTPNIKKWMLKILSKTSYVTSSLVLKNIVVLFVVSQAYALSVRINNLSAVLVGISLSNAKFVRRINLIKELSSSIILIITKSISKPLSISSSVTNSLIKKLYVPIYTEVTSDRVITRAQTLFKTLYVYSPLSAIISRVPRIIMTYLVNLNVTSIVTAYITRANEIAQTFYQTLTTNSEVLPQSTKTLQKTFSVTISNIVSLIRSWG